MTSAAANEPVGPEHADLGDAYALRDALLAEREAYAAMRDLVPDLVLPMAMRAPMDDRQREAIELYRGLRDRLEQLRSAHRSTGSAGLSLVADQSA